MARSGHSSASSLRSASAPWRTFVRKGRQLGAAKRGVLDRLLVECGRVGALSFDPRTRVSGRPEKRHRAANFPVPTLPPLIGP